MSCICVIVQVDLISRFVRESNIDVELPGSQKILQVSRCVPYEVLSVSTAIGNIQELAAALPLSWSLIDYRFPSGTNVILSLGTGGPSSTADYLKVRYMETNIRTSGGYSACRSRRGECGVHVSIGANVYVHSESVFVASSRARDVDVRSLLLLLGICKRVYVEPTPASRRYEAAKREEKVAATIFMLHVGHG